MRTQIKIVAVVIACAALGTACAPKVGSEKWCKQMKEKAKADWTANEARDFAKHCVFK